MTHKEIIELTATTAGISKAAAGRLIQTLTYRFKAEVANGGEVKWAGLGKLYAQDRKPRRGRNPRTGEGIDIPARRVLRIRESKRQVGA